MKLFIGSRSEELGKKVAELTKIPVGKWQLFRFGDSELKPQIQDNVRGEDVIVFQTTSKPVNESYMELFLLVDALRRSACGRIILAMPYYGYSRQNQQHLPGEPVSAQIMAKFLEGVGVDEIITLDLHEEQITGFFTIPMTHLSALPLLAKSIGEEILSRHAELVSASSLDRTLNQVQGDAKHIIVVSPDQGGVERTRKFRDALAEYFNTRHPEGVKTTEGSIQIDSSPADRDQNDKVLIIVDEEIGVVEKLRNLEGMHETKMVEITGELQGKIVVIPDDVIVSGGTILHAAAAAIQKGATNVYLAATHADFIEGTAKNLQNSKVEKVFVTDTIHLEEQNGFPKLQTVSCANLLADSVSKLGV